MVSLHSPTRSWLLISWQSPWDCSWDAITHHIGSDEVVPTAFDADLHNVDLKLADLLAHLFYLVVAFYPA